MTVSSFAELKGAGSTVGSSGSSAITHGWINTVPLSASSTLSKRTLIRSKQQAKNNDSYVKDYIRKRNLILDLLVSFSLWYMNTVKRSISQPAQFEPTFSS